MLHHIATEGGTSAYVNPHSAGRVVASWSSTDSGSVEDFVAGPWPRTACHTRSERNSLMAVDLGAGRQLVVKQ